MLVHSRFKKKKTFTGTENLRLQLCVGNTSNSVLPVSRAPMHFSLHGPGSLISFETKEMQIRKASKGDGLFPGIQGGELLNQAYLGGGVPSL